MELKTFISNTICEIQEGVQDAINRTVGVTNGAINPNWGEPSEYNQELIQKVQFDIAVTAQDEGKDGVKGGIKVVGLTLGGESTSSSSTSKVSRIQFTIPIIPPVCTISNSHQKTRVGISD
ncbi:hypothetical protein [Pseudoalteromonas sp. Of7M-16]|uniref:hypothetical protein n=1 Tax=Pseudoalteromonas sp. Of7M-16 TaxID=2917756 RepID=UPI001EF6797B|nr:hypothetical protein [Pseudoalteromonas sp. Of7M-16]MCG7549218.1 hypothetical protein [Pseudoalteromonas sp. Of7M-16]